MYGQAKIAFSLYIGNWILAYNYVQKKVLEAFGVFVCMFNC